MQINYVEIQNFRKLKSVRIDLSSETTLLVGANNSGKTSAMIALRHFLIDRGAITSTDFTISHWRAVNSIGERWQSPTSDGAVPTPTLAEWNGILPTLDVWLAVGGDEVHFIRPLLPSLDWTGGVVGARLRFEPKDLVLLQQEFLAARASVKTVMESAAKAKKKAKTKYTLSLWPSCLIEFLEKKISSYFTINAYVLDPSKQTLPVNGIAKPQELDSEAVPLDRNPFDGIIAIDEIPAHRGMEDSWGTPGSTSGQSPRRARLKLSEQLQSYYITHLDPARDPEPSDIDALQAIDDAQKVFDDRLTTHFDAAITELQSLNYPGFADPKLKISTLLKPLEGLNHRSAVSYEVACLSNGKTKGSTVRLPEDYNGLGFQNLISIVFKLMSFRDAWLRVGKAAKSAPTTSESQITYPPLHLVLIEEPEAHLHVQVQQVFVKHAYQVLRNHKDLRSNKTLHTQLVVSTHSSHVAHECEFGWLRYFSRIRPSADGEVPTAAVLNLSEVFGANDATGRFVARYLRSTHCELFFADAVIVVEGLAERMLIPHFIRRKHEELDRKYISLLELGGSHAHRFQALIQKLGVPTLIVTDLDPKNPKTKESSFTKRGEGLISGNHTLKSWHPKKELVDELLIYPEADKHLDHADGRGSIRIAFQTPIEVVLKSKPSVECVPTTFEDALILTNHHLFSQFVGTGMLKKVKDAIASSDDAQTLAEEVYKIVRSGVKGEFALDLLWADKPLAPEDGLTPPKYIADGLDWLELKLRLEPVTVPQAKAD